MSKEDLAAVAFGLFITALILILPLVGIAFELRDMLK